MKRETPARGHLEEHWSELKHLLHIIETLFCDVLDAPARITRSAARDIALWLRDAEAAARALLLAMAHALVLTPLKRRARAQNRKPAQGPRTAPLWRFDVVPQQSRYRFVRRKGWREKPEELSFFARDLLAYLRIAGREKRAAYLAENPPQPQPLFEYVRSPAGRNMPPDAPRALIEPVYTRAGAVRRFNGLIMVTRDPARFAQRLARRLDRSRDRKDLVRRVRARRPHWPGNPEPPREDFVQRCLAESAHDTS